MYRAACADCDPCVALWLRCVAKSPAPSWNRRRVCRRSRPDRTAQRTCIATRAGCVSKLGARCPAGSWDSTQTRDNGDESTIYETPLYIHVGLKFLHSLGGLYRRFPLGQADSFYGSDWPLRRLRAPHLPLPASSAHLRRDVQLGFRCRLRRRRPRLGFRPARADGMWATGPSSHMLK